MTLRSRLHDESGSALVIALVVLIIALGLGFAALTTSDVQSHQTRTELGGEASFNLAESALDAQARLLQLTWPGTTASSTTCNQLSAAGTTCPGATVTNSFAQAYAGKEFGSPTPTWSTQVIDDSGTESSRYYSDPAPATATNCDCNADNTVWVRAQANVFGQQRIVVAQVVRQTIVIPLP